MKRNLVLIIIIYIVIFITTIIYVDSLSRFFFDIKTNEIYPRFEILKLLLQVSGGIAVLIGLFISIRRLSLSEKNIEYSAQTIRLSYESLKTERFKNYIENLSSNSSEIRISSFYSLVGMAKSEPAERENILNILTSFLRNRTKNDLIQPDEIQILLNNMFRHNNKTLFSDLKINFENVHFNKLNLIDSIIVSVSFHGSILKHVLFDKSNLTSSYFTYTKLDSIQFDDCDLSYSQITDSELTSVSFCNANLLGVHFNNCVIKNCNFSFAKGINMDTFAKAKLLQNCINIDIELTESLKEHYPELIII